MADSNPLAQTRLPPPASDVSVTSSSSSTPLLSQATMRAVTAPASAGSPASATRHLSPLQHAILD
jgi:hypothetical protein